MDLKRVLTTVLGLPIVALLFVLGNEYVIGVAVLIVSIISMYEYFEAVKKVAKPIQWVGYLSNLYIVGAMFLETEKLLQPYIGSSSDGFGDCKESLAPLLAFKKSGKKA